MQNTPELTWYDNAMRQRALERRYGWLYRAAKKLERRIRHVLQG